MLSTKQQGHIQIFKYTSLTSDTLKSDFESHFRYWTWVHFPVLWIYSHIVFFFNFSGRSAPTGETGWPYRENVKLTVQEILTAVQIKGWGSGGQSGKRKSITYLLVWDELCKSLSGSIAIQKFMPVKPTHPITLSCSFNNVYQYTTMFSLPLCVPADTS